MDKIRIVMYGVTHEHAVGKIHTLKRLSDTFDVVGIVDDRASTTARYPQAPRMEEFAGFPLWTPEEFARRNDFDAIVVEVTNGDLVKVAQECAKKGVPMHVDKPGGETVEPFDGFLLDCQKRKLPIQLGYMFRYNPAFQYCLELVKKGVLGDIYEIQIDMNHSYGTAEYAPYISTFKGGLMYNLVCHLIDYVVLMMGKPDEIHSWLKNTPNQPPEMLNNCLAVMSYPHATATLRSCSEDVGRGRRFRLAGTNGVVDMSPIETFTEPIKLTLSLRKASGNLPGGVHHMEFWQVFDRYEAQFAEFAKVIRHEIPAPDLTAHDRLVHRAILAASQLADWDKIKNF